MAKYSILFKESVEKDIRKLPKSTIKNIIKKISDLENNLTPYGSIKLKGEEFYRIRTGDYRIVYTINNKFKSVTIWYIRHRKDAYKVI